MIAAGCTPDCERTCRKVLDCGIDTPQITVEQCQIACESEEHLYEVWEDDAKRDAFRAERSCLVESTCEEIAEGVCYHEDMYIF